MIPPPVALACRQLHAEAIPLFYKANVFDISIQSTAEDARQFEWLSRRPPDLLKDMRCDVVSGRFNFFQRLPGQWAHLWLAARGRKPCEKMVDEYILRFRLPVARKEWSLGRKLMRCTNCLHDMTEYGCVTDLHICRLTFL